MEAGEAVDSPCSGKPGVKFMGLLSPFWDYYLVDWQGPVPRMILFQYLRSQPHSLVRVYIEECEWILRCTAEGVQYLFFDHNFDTVFSPCCQFSKTIAVSLDSTPIRIEDL